MPRLLWWSWGVGRFLMSEAPLYTETLRRTPGVRHRVWGAGHGGGAVPPPGVIGPCTLLIPHRVLWSYDGSNKQVLIAEKVAAKPRHNAMMLRAHC